MRGTRLLDRLESRHFEVEDHHDKCRRERREMVDAEASSPNLGGESREMLRVQQCPILPLVDSFSDVVTASRQRWKNVQILQIYLCFFWGGCANILAVYAQTN